MKLGLFGGSFDPIHQGHVLPVREARRALGLDRVLYLVTAKPPHKPRRALAPPHARYTMVELALLGEEGLYASPDEMVLDRPAYTIETLEHFRQTEPAADLHLLIGGDSFADLHLWYRWREIPAAARLVVLTRPGWELDARALHPELAALSATDRVIFLRQPPVDISSTRLRELFARGEQPPEGQVSDLVVRYVQKYDLYR
ncbi:MAG TPA: nicotinate (nicotinamide) nucleotide adenylyltransferase [Thermoanaerobaculia bacterium]|nr:nicotinate (nicotinamide) nucleotide adenylyltransferase [Thermoanaerobaculia bacterium]